ncbi:hypothetical protein AGOR_G00241550 [Albula goreensis]|uniref:Thrombopoietin n=1 Tax=Albula goreensis TaxID=1534307 RepID=A0A8T3CDK1_9TELE|nr:hypothetical protein AGOR_G00241550 [Albula goreensis]
MDSSRLLLLLLCTTASKVRDVQARPIDFVCDDQARRDMNMVKELEAGMRECRGSDKLPLAIPLPCVKIHKASWENKSMQEKRGDILAALQTLVQGVRENRPLVLAECQLSLLERLDRSVTNYLHIVTHMELSGEPESLVTSCPSQSTQNLGHVLWHFSRLLTGKLEWLVSELSSQCHVEQTTSIL